MYDRRYKSHFANSKEPVMPQRWAIIIDAVTTLEWRWQVPASLRIYTLYCHMTPNRSTLAHIWQG